MTEKTDALLALFLTALLAGCTTAPASKDAMNVEVVAQDDNFALVRMRPGQETSDIAAAMLGEAGRAWQIDEVNAGGNAAPGDIVAVPLAPVNPTSVYPEGYRTLPILCYHQFTREAEIDHRLELRAKDFEKQLRYLLDNGYQILSFADVSEILLQGRPIPPKAVVITIDDGYDSVYDVAWPILKELGVKATLFIYTDFIGGGSALTWEEIQEMQGSGLIEIESHAKSHTSLSRLLHEDDESAYTERVRGEYEESQAVFAHHTGKAPLYLSYPYGNSSAVAVRLAREVGYALAATVTRGDNSTFADPLLLHRAMIYGDDDLQAFARNLRTFRRKPLQ